MLRAGIDIGTNTVLLLIAEVEGRKVSRVLRDEVRVVRLGQGVDTNKNFSPEAIARARACFAEYAEILKEYPGIPVRAVATSGSRDAANSRAFFAEIRKEHGIPIEVISGEEEALLSFRGALSGEAEDAAKLAVLDIGGGSTEIVGLKEKSFGKTNFTAEDLFKFSFDIGCVRLTERFLKSDPPEAAEIASLRAYVKELIFEKSALFRQMEKRTLVGVAGTATYLASSALGLRKFDPEKVHGSRLGAADLKELIQKFSVMSAAERLGIGGMDKGRADVIVGGAIILQEVMDLAKLASIRVSVRGLRYGAVLS